MAKKKLHPRGGGGIVYSTSPDFTNEEQEENQDSLPEAEQPLIVQLDKKNRGGKTVTLIKGFVLGNEEIENLCRQLKAFCGSGGAAKNNEIIIQGDHREKVKQWFLKKGFLKTSKK